MGGCAWLVRIYMFWIDDAMRGQKYNRVIAIVFAYYCCVLLQFAR